MNLRPFLAAAALGAAILVKPSPAQAQQEVGICQTVAGCSAGPQSCATLEFEATYGGATVHVTKYCYQQG